MNNNILYMTVTVAFMVGLAIIGIMISRGIKDTEDWMVAGKSLGKLPMAWLVERCRNTFNLIFGLYVFCQENEKE